MIEVSAPGKIHLIGEHSICYGFPAIISAIEKRIRIKVEEAKKIKIKNNIYKREGEFEINEVLSAGKDALRLWQEGNKKNDFSELFEFLKSDFWKRSQAMISLILDQFKIKQGVSLTIDSDLPVGVGLGSSASLSVAITKAIAELYAPQISNRKINEIAFELEKLNHGRPSGGDNSVCTFGGTIWFEPSTRGTVPLLSLSCPSPVPVKPCEKGEIEPLFLPDFLQNLIIVLTPRKKLNTGYFIQKVRNLEPNFRNPIMESLGKIAFEMKQGLRDENLEEIKNLINLAQDNLAKLGISNPEIDCLVKEVRKIGGAAKISGAGGGTLICFYQDKKKIIELLKKLKINFQEVKLGAKGVKTDL